MAKSSKNVAMNIGSGGRERKYFPFKSSTFPLLQPLKTKFLIKTIIFNIDWCHRLTFFHIHEWKKDKLHFTSTRRLLYGLYSFRRWNSEHKLDRNYEVKLRSQFGPCYESEVFKAPYKPYLPEPRKTVFHILHRGKDEQNKRLLLLL